MVLDLTLYIIISSAGATLTQLIGTKPGMNPIKSSALLAVAFYLSLQLLGLYHVFEIERWAALFFGATFVGMSTKERLRFVPLVAASIIYAIIFYLASPFYNGIGGALGVSACFSVILVLVIQNLIRFFRLKYGQ